MICAKPLKGGEALEEIPRVRGSFSPLDHDDLGVVEDRYPAERSTRFVGGGLRIVRLDDHHNRGHSGRNPIKSSPLAPLAWGGHGQMAEIKQGRIP